MPLLPWQFKSVREELRDPAIAHPGKVVPHQVKRDIEQLEYLVSRGTETVRTAAVSSM